MQVEAAYWIKGSGTSNCLLTNSQDDELNFIPFKLPFQPNLLRLAGLFMIGTDKQQIAYIWGQVGSSCDPIPRILLPEVKVEQVSCGWDHALLASDHILFGVGDNAYGQVGGDGKYYSEAKVMGEGKFTCIGAGFRQSYWVGNDQIIGCGESKNFQLGLKEKKPMKPTILSNQVKEVKKIVCGKKYALFLTAKKEVYGLGTNDKGALPIEGTICPSVQLIKQNVDDVCSGWSHTIWLVGGKVYSWGRNNFGQLGRLVGPNQTGEDCRVNIDEEILIIESGTQFNFAVGKLGQLYGWGWNQHSNIITEGETVPFPVKVPHQGKVISCFTYPAITVIKTIQ